MEYLLEFWGTYGTKILTFVTSTLVPILFLYIKSMIKEARIEKKQQLKLLDSIASKGDYFGEFKKVRDENLVLKEEIEHTSKKIDGLGEILNVIVDKSDVDEKTKTDIKLLVDNIKTENAKSVVKSLLEENEFLKGEISKIQKENAPKIVKPETKSNRVRV